MQPTISCGDINVANRSMARPIIVGAMDTPAAEVDIDDALVGRLLRAQHPDLADLGVRLVANGWDNAIFRLGEGLCVRLPRRKAAVDLILHEQRWLPGLAANVRVPIPVPQRIGRPGLGYPWPWTITAWHEGTLAADLDPADRTGIAVALADFMVGWHVPAPPDAPANPWRGIPLADRDSGLREQLSAGRIPRWRDLLRLWDRLVGTPQWTDAPVWLHADPHPANMVVRDGGLAAVLDFGDLTSGDPATDLAAAWMVFDAEGRAAFRARVDPDEHTWARAHGWALVFGTVLSLHADDNPPMAAVGAHTVDQVLAAF